MEDGISRQHLRRVMTLVRFNVAFNSEGDGKMFTERWLQVGEENVCKICSNFN